MFDIISELGLEDAVKTIDAEVIDDAYLARAWAKARAAHQEIKALIPEYQGQVTPSV